ncbi:MAG: hypothetical protein AAGF99_01165 [Bacteroidota bacterium]
MSDYIDEAIETGALRMVVEPLGGQRYQVTITSDDRTSPWGPWTEPITMQPDHPAPALGQVVYYTAKRLQAVEDTDDFLDWCQETDREPGDTKALARYRDLVDLRDQVRATMGDDAYNGLLAAYAIDQAVSRARALLDRASLGPGSHGGSAGN